MDNVVEGLIFLILGFLALLSGMSANLWRREESRYRMGAIVAGLVFMILDVHFLNLLYASLLTPVASRNLVLYQSLPITIRYRHAFLRRRKDDPGVGPAARSLTA